MSAAANPPSSAARAVRLVLGIVLGAVLGAMANMGMLAAATALIPPPAGVDANDPASINAQIAKNLFIAAIQKVEPTYNVETLA